MLPNAQNPPSDIVLYIRRANPSEGKGGIKPADPLANPFIQPGHASSYEVTAGQYIQIMDVQGRICTDFQAFSSAMKSPLWVESSRFAAWM